MGRGGDCFSILRPADPPAQCRGWSGWVTGALICGTGHVFGVLGLGLGGLWRIPCYFPSYVRPDDLHIRGQSHPTVGVARFGPKASDQLSSLNEELPVRMTFCLVYSFQD